MVLSMNYKPAVIFVGVVVVLFVAMSPRGATMETGGSWKSLDMKKDALPSDLAAKRKKVEITQDTVDVFGTPVFVQRAQPAPGVEPSGKNVLLLHGAAFTSQTWVDKVPTLATLSALGHNVVAVDLPGYGKTPQVSLEVKNEKFLAQLMKTLFRGEKAVVITPSMSGSFFIPFLEVIEYRSLLVSGWVPVAPVGTGSVPKGFFSAVENPTMFVYGEKDTGLGHRSRDDLSELPNATEPQMLENAGHPAYLDQPEVWHTLLYNFINHL